MERIIIYQILGRLFGNRCHERETSGTIEDNGCGKLNDLSDLALKSIQQLGATHIWYTGLLEHASQTAYPKLRIKADPSSIVKGMAGSPYAIRDYYDIDPDLAVEPNKRMQEFDSMQKRVHNNGLKLIIDFVPNHVARVYHSDCAPEGVKDFGVDDDTSQAFAPNNNFYYIPGQPFTPTFPLDGYKEMPAKATGNDCFSATPGEHDWYETVKLNYGVNYLQGKQKYFDPRPDTWDKMCNILLYWAGKGVDGFRCDMAEMVPVEFWQWAIAEVKSHYPQIIFIAEVYQPALYRSYLNEGGFDYLYDKVGLYDTLRGIMEGHRSTREITYAWQQVSDIRDKMVNFLENHDEQRIASSFFAKDARKGLPGLLVSSLISYSPTLIYFAQELGEKGMDAEGFSGCDGRTTIFDYWNLLSIQRWQNQDNWDDALLHQEELNIRLFYRRVLTLANSEIALRQGQFYDLMWLNYDNPAFNCDKHFAFVRHYYKEIIVCLINFNDQANDIGLIIGQHCLDQIGIPANTPCKWRDLLSMQTYSTFLDPNVPLTFHVKGNSGLILKYSLN